MIRPSVFFGWHLPAPHLTQDRDDQRKYLYHHRYTRTKLQKLLLRGLPTTLAQVKQQTLNELAYLLGIKRREKKGNHCKHQPL